MTIHSNGRTTYLANKTYLFIDESGDPVYYGNRKKLLLGTKGFQPYLIIGKIETDNRKPLRKAVVGFMNSIKTDSLYNSIPSIATDIGWFVHARGDHSEIRAKFFGRKERRDFQCLVENCL